MIEDPAAQGARAASEEIDPFVWAEVSRIHHWLAEECSRAEVLAARIDHDARVLSRRVVTVQEVLFGAHITAWRDLSGLVRPPAATIVRFRELARFDARYTVLCQRLYPRVSTEDVVRRRRTDWVERRSDGEWPGHDASGWSAPADAIVARTWGPLHTADFLRYARRLIEMRLRDSRPVPVTPLDPLAATLTSTICDTLVRNGLPPV
ncbi:hypothetical protein [Nocardia asteroides]|uniref:hypothetical protein n=1 Tax=Nocardia asteroides TaxID=1824 RepID=UPI00341D9866